MNDLKSTSTRRQLLPIRMICCVALASLLTLAVAEEAKDVASVTTNGRAGKLQPLNTLIGQWRGVGQPKRGSRKGAWQETTVCRWDFTGEDAAVLLDAKKGAQFEQLRLSTSASGKQLQLTQRINDTESRIYEGRLPESWPEKTILESKADGDGVAYRCTIEQLSPIRLVLLFERRATLSGSYRRIAGIGYTRSGHKLAESDGNQRECVVTGGQGTIKVMHKGKTWYVCCEGCRQAFEDSPDEIIADYLARNDD